MSQVDFAQMTDEQLKQYIIQHQNDQDALAIYLARRSKKNLPVLANVKDDDFDEKVQMAIAQQLEQPNFSALNQD